MTKIGNNKNSIFDIFNYAIMSILCITILFPLIDMLWTSLTPVNTIRLSYLLPSSSISFDAYTYIFTENSMFAALGVSVFRTVVGTILHLIIVLLAAYPMSKSDLKG
ncbi:MAG: hypothetical protein FIA99_19755 [Ruminiclostridium sp.]|nr:hypothetical protein [Ruminiclostridium sp.]